MRTTQIVFALILAAFLFFVLKLLGLFLKFALIAAVLGFVVGLLLWHCCCGTCCRSSFGSAATELLSKCVSGLRLSCSLNMQETPSLPQRGAV